MILALQGLRRNLLLAGFLLVAAPVSGQDMTVALAPASPVIDLAQLDATDLLDLAQNLRTGVRVVDGNPLLVPQHHDAREALEKVLATGELAPAAAKLMLAKMLIAGEGGQVDIDRAIDLLAAALADGDPEAGTILGLQLLQISGRDNEAAQALLLALRLGDAAAGLDLADFYQFSDPDQAKRLRTLALQLLEVRAARQDGDAMFELAEHYRQPGAAQDTAKALDLYASAFEAGNERALYWMARIRADIGPLNNGPEAVRLYSLAAERGSIEAARSLTSAYANGELDVSSDVNTLWLIRLVEIGDVESRLRLANQTGASTIDRDMVATRLFEDLLEEDTPAISDLLDLGGKFRDGLEVTADPARALQLFKRALDRGSKDGVLRYAELLLEQPALQRPENLQVALQNLHLIAEAGSVSGAVVLGDFYTRGLGVASNQDLARQWYEQAAQGGNSLSAMSRIAEQHLRSTDPQTRREALPWLEKAAIAGSITAQVTLAKSYAEGDWVEFNPVRAISWYQTAISAGDVSSLEPLAELHLHIGGQAGLQMAREVFVEATEAGMEGASLRYANFLTSIGRGDDAIAQLESSDQNETVAGSLLLHRVYSEGIGVPVDAGRAAMYLERARSDIGTNPAERLQLAAILIALPDLEQQSTAFTMLVDLVAQRVSGAPRLLGDAYIKGLGTTANVETGLNIYNQAIRGADRDAAIGLVELYLDGSYLPKDPQAALALLEAILATAPKDSAANISLAELYSSGALGSPDLQKAVEHYLIAASAGSNAARLALGKMYMWGAGVDRDAAESARWLQAADLGGAMAAQALLADLKGTGLASAVNPTQAFAHSFHAAQRGDVEAMRHLGSAMLSGFGVATDRDAGIAWLERAASANSGDAMYDLFRVYDEGAAGPTDPDMARNWLQRAAELGNGSALYRLALASVQADGALTDPNAIALLQTAARANHNQSKKMLVRLGLLSISEAEAGYTDE